MAHIIRKATMLFTTESRAALIEDQGDAERFCFSFQFEGFTEPFRQARSTKYGNTTTEHQVGNEEIKAPVTPMSGGLPDTYYSSFADQIC